MAVPVKAAGEEGGGGGVGGRGRGGGGGECRQQRTSTIQLLKECSHTSHATRDSRRICQHNSIPCVAGSLQGHSVLGVIDTGAPDNYRLYQLGHLVLAMCD